jgi:hypothetical protein
MPMNRRNFLRTLIGGVAAAAAVRTFPFRVFSFPSKPLVHQATNQEILALQLERFGHRIPDLIARDQRLYRMMLESEAVERRHGGGAHTIEELILLRGDVREVCPDKGFLPLGSAPPRIKSIDTDNRVIVWES